MSRSIVHLRLNGDVTDSIGTYSSTSTTVTWDTGKIASCAVCVSGDNSYLSNVQSDCTWLDGKNPNVTAFSIMAWIKPADLVSTSSIYMEVGSGAGSNQRFYVGNSSAKWRLGFGANGFSGDTAGTSTITTGWTHVCIVSNTSTSSGDLYINGAYDHSRAYGGTYTLQSSNFGYSHYTGSDATGGSVDDMRVYDYALSATEIAYLYNAGNGTEMEIMKLNTTYPSYVNGVSRKSIAFINGL
jgi:hypothetical protein